MAQREKRHRICLSVTEEEADTIAENAKQCGYATAEKSGSASHVKALALGYTPRTVFDKQVGLDIGKLHRDLGRCGTN